MALSPAERRICEVYGRQDATGHVRCRYCPLALHNKHPMEYTRHDLMCKANSHYDRHKREWVPDEVEEQDA